MPSWLDRLLGRAPRRSAVELLAVIAEDPLADRRRWVAALDALSRDPETWRVHLPTVRERMRRWYAEHPLEVRWEDELRCAVVDPLDVSTDVLLSGDDSAALAPWAVVLRTLDVRSDGPNVFHHGLGVPELLALLRDPSCPAEIENLPIPFLLLDRADEGDALVDALVGSPNLHGLLHLRWPEGVRLGGAAVERLSRAPWAGALRTLGLCELMVDWSVDLPPEERHAAFRALGRFRSLTHLDLYNDVGDPSDLAALLENPFPELVWLSLGSIPADPAFLEILASTRSLPKLEALRLASGPDAPSAWDRACEAPFPIWLHGRRVTATYPKR